MVSKKYYQNPEIVEYENVRKVREILEEYFDEDDSMNEHAAKEILKELKVPLGKRKVIKIFEDNIKVRRWQSKLTP